MLDVGCAMCDVGCGRWDALRVTNDTPVEKAIAGTDLDCASKLN
jgi:hypothetical protein